MIGGSRNGARGFSLVEIMMAMLILSITLGGFAALTFQYVRRVQVTTGVASKTMEVSEQVQRLSALTFDSLASRAGCTTFSSGEFPHIRCITIATVGTGTRHKRVTIIITPVSPLIKPDTVVFDRTKTPTSNPLNS